MRRILLLLALTIPVPIVRVRCAKDGEKPARKPEPVCRASSAHSEEPRRSTPFVVFVAE